MIRNRLSIKENQEEDTIRISDLLPVSVYMTDFSDRYYHKRQNSFSDCRKVLFCQQRKWIFYQQPVRSFCRTCRTGFCLLLCWFSSQPDCRGRQSGSLSGCYCPIFIRKSASGLSLWRQPSCRCPPHQDRKTDREHLRGRTFRWLGTPAPWRDSLCLAGHSKTCQMFRDAGHARKQYLKRAAH